MKAFAQAAAADTPAAHADAYHPATVRSSATSGTSARLKVVRRDQGHSCRSAALEVGLAPFLSPHQEPAMIVFVTGASAGFGAAIARTFVKGGHRVVATARRKDRLQALGEEQGG